MILLLILLTAFLVIIALRTICICRLIHEKYPPEDK